jgi:hypothetical protein
MWKRKEAADEPFDDSSYVPEPTDHFGSATDNLQKLAAGGAVVAGLYYLAKMAIAAGIFN